jgi:hypothetical protein
MALITNDHHRDEPSADLPDGLALYWIELKFSPDLSLDDALDEEWREDFVWQKLGVLNWDKRLDSLSPHQNVALNQEQERREMIAVREREKFEAFKDFLRSRGAIVASGSFRVLPPPSAGEVAPEPPSATSFLVAESEDIVRALHESPLSEILSIEKAWPSRLFAAATNSKWVCRLPEVLPEDDAISYAMRARPTGDLEADAKLWELVGRNVEAFNRMRRTQRRETTSDAGATFLVERLIPRGKITLVVGAKKTGKSTLMTELAVTAARGGGEFCGLSVPAEACKGTVVLICGEDDEETLFARLERMDPDQTAIRLYASPNDDKTLADIIAVVDQMPAVSAVIIDPLRQYLEGNEDSSDAVSAFYNQLLGLIRRKGCAVIVVHHPGKADTFSSLAAVVQSARGSSTLLDRPRVLIGMMRRGERTVLGIPVIDGKRQHNITPPELMIEDEIALVLDPVTMRHERVGAARAAKSDPPKGASAQETTKTTRGSNDVERVVAATQRLVGEGARVTRTGANSLYKLKPPELAGMSRRQIEAAVGLTVEGGRLRDGPTGVVPSDISDFR